MGSRKRIISENRKEIKKKIFFAHLNKIPTSPRKMRIVVDLIRNMQVNKALNILEYNKKYSSIYIKKLLISVISNWKLKNLDKNIKEDSLYIKEIKVNNASMIKRINFAPQGRSHRIRKRSNHLSIILENRNFK